MLAVFLAAVTAAVPGGVYFEQTTVVREGGAVPLPGVRSRVWCQGPRMRLEPAGTSGPALVLRIDSGRALRLDPERRIATELDVARLRSRSQTDAAVAAAMMTSPGEGEPRTVRLPGSRTLAGHVCRGYRIRSGTLVVDAWVARDVPVRADVFADFLDWSGLSQALSEIIRAIRSLPGFPLETRMRLDVLGTTRETVSTITAVRPLVVPGQLFEVPPGWGVVKEEAPIPEVP